MCASASIFLHYKFGCAIWHFSRHLQVAQTVRRHVQKVKMKNSQKVIHSIGRFFLKLARYFFDRTTLACWCCGDLVGMRSNYAEGHMWCEPCFQRYVAPRRYVAEHSAQADQVLGCASCRYGLCPDDKGGYIPCTICGNTAQPKSALRR